MGVNEILVLLMFLTFICLLFTGAPIAFVLGGVAILFTLVGWFCDLYFGTWTGLNFNMLGLAADRMFNIVSNWVLVAIPMFVFMGLMLDRSGTAEDMMQSMQKLFGRVRGGLAVTVILIGIILAASTGIIGASVVLLALLSLPAMMHQGYSKSLASGTVAASGTLGILIPPSIMLVIMADQLSVSVGDLFMGAMIPGILLGCLYIGYVVIFGLFRPNDLPLPEDVQPVTWKVVVDVLKNILPTATLIVLVLGSIFAGVASPTEASGVGAFGATILAFYQRKLTVKVIKEVTEGTFRVIGFIFGIWVGATLFAMVVRLLGGDDVIEHLLTSLPLGPHGIILIVLFVVFLLGFFLDWIEITLIILPLLAPVVSKLPLGIDGGGVLDNAALVWFAILVAMTLQTSFLTPPMGPAIFFIQGVNQDIDLLKIYRGVIPFVIFQLIAIVLLFLFPKLSIWLPIVVYG
ncbi:MAG: TRAP transporter large permease subunit [Deltaproteobacteria bacterium]|nr:TRAP transporter large permease subunit [Deltaproteobacteria bacterium]